MYWICKYTGTCVKTAWNPILYCKYAISLSNCTSALHLALKVLDIKTGDDLKIDLTENTLTNKTQEKTYDLKSLGEVIEIIEAGNIFEYARKTGMIPS